MTASAQERNYGQAQTLKIWDNTTAPHSNGITAPEQDIYPDRTSNVTETTLYLFPANKAKATGQAVVICPGGGYALLCMDYEGYQMAQWFAANGITAAVLKYRMPNGHPEVPLEDAEQALRKMNELYPDAKIGIAGSSAGGHLAAMTSTMATQKPAFSILFYPVITGEAGKGHKDSFDRLLGMDRSDSLTMHYSLENRVSNTTPPALLLLSDDDRGVLPISSTRYYNALKEHGIPASMHIYPTGGHGWGIRNNFKYLAQWQEAVLDWMKRINE